MSLFCLNIFSQTDTLIYLEEDFENSNNWDTWTSYPEGSPIWERYDGGRHSDQTTLPPSAYEGEYNALFQRTQTEPVIRTLISKPINLSGAKKPQLSFYHAQAQAISGLDNLILMFQVGAGEWDTIVSFLNPIEDWTYYYLNINEYGSQYLADNFYLGFMGVAKGGHGVCIDNIIIEEKDVIQKYPRTVKASNVSHPLIPSGLDDIPVLKVEVEMFGNAGNSLLKSIAFKSLCPDNSVFKSNGFELIITQEDFFATKHMGASTKFGTAQSITGNDIVFNNLNYNLKTGFNYIWLIADIKAEATHGSVVDFMINANSININGSTYPTSAISPSGQNTIEESVFYDDFETLKGWTLDPSGDFEIAVPLGLPAGISTDPSFAYSGQKILGTDLTVDGGYMLNIDSANAYHATTPSINLKYYNNIKLSAKKWVAFEPTDRASIDISTDGGTNWERIWLSHIDALNPEYTWNSLILDDEVNGFASRQENVKFRYSIYYSDNSNVRAGWNIDNFAVTGLHLTNDVSVRQIMQPWDDCSESVWDTVKVIVKNLAEYPTGDELPIFYSIYGADTLRVYDTIRTSIDSYDSIVFAFTKQIDFTSPGYYDKFIVMTDVSGDQDPTNDSLTMPLYIQESLASPSYVNFETAAGYWKSEPASTWMWKSPEGSIPDNPGSLKSWILSPFGPYINSDTSYIESSCYDLTDSYYKVLELKYWSETETGKDGANIQYSVNDGQTWNLLDTNSMGWNIAWNWYRQPVTALGKIGWSGISPGWVTAKQLLPLALNSQSKVKFRVVWASDENNNANGLAIDDFNIYHAPPDIGVVSIDSPVDDCLNEVSDQVTVSIKNFGLSKVHSNDTLVYGYVFDGNPAVYDTMMFTGDLNPGSSTIFSFSEKINLTTAKQYQLSVFTIFDDDPWFYGSNNDTLSKTIEAFPLPFTGLPDTIQSREPDTVILRAYKNPDYTYLWEGGMSTADTLKVPGDGVYHLLVTDVGGNGCYVIDSVYVELLYSDIGIDTIIAPVSSCELSESEQITVRIKNFGTDSIIAGSKVAVSYVFEGGPAVSDTLLLSKALQSHETKLFTFAGKYENFSALGSHDLKLYAYYGGDTVRYNDTLNLNVEVFGYPTVDIGGDKVIEALTYPLDAGAGFVTYLWEDGDSVRIHIADATGLYHVMVLDNHGCPGYDTAFIRLKIRDVSPYRLVYPTSACNVLGNVNVQIQVRNTGNDTIPQNSKVYVKYKLGSQPIRSDSIILSSPLYPGGTVNRTFANVENLNVFGEYDFLLYATTKNDLNPDNDTMYDTIFLQPKPVVDFGLDDVYAHRGLDFVLDAGYGEFYDYLWQDGKTEQTYSVTKSGEYSVVVTDSRTGCYAGDTVTIYLIITDVGITAVNLAADTCSGSYSNVQVEIRNLGSYSIASGDTIHVAYTLNNSLIGNDEFILTSVFPFGTKIDRNLSGTINLTDGTSATLRFYTVLDEDLRPENDTFVIDYGVVKRSPVIDFHDVSGVIITDFPYVLIPEAGHPSYLWQDNSTESTYTVTAPGAYSVTVTASNGCRSSKTVNVVNETGIDEPVDDPFSLRVYPNPAGDFLNLEVDVRETEDVIVEFYNSEGRLIFNDRAVSGSLYYRSIDVSPYPGGICYIRLFNSEIFRIYKVVIF
ncbi:MAG: hypothetical protein A2Y71_13705 [Bacteroidetes bacterium RBG_13_42_15]|nr:MAG: hypothetical protein A2Y71_13705 [Bacteroidetes bacterium RBG_13_42_15]